MYSRLKKTAKISGIFLGSLLLIFITFRQTILNKIVQRVAVKIHETYGLRMDIGEIRFSGITTVSISKLRLYPESGDTLLSVDTLSLNPAFLRLLIGTLRINELYCADGSLLLSSHGNVSNYASLLKHKNNSTTFVSSDKSGHDYAQLFSNIADHAFNFAPQKGALKNISLILSNDSLHRKVSILYLSSDENLVNGHFIEHDENHEWVMDGKFSQRKKTLDIHVRPLRDHQLLPLLPELTGLAVGFSEVHLTIDELKTGSSKLMLAGSFETNSVQIFHKRIAEDTVFIPPAKINFHFTADHESFSLDSSTVATLGKITVHPSLYFTTVPSKQILFEIKTDEVASTDFFQSLPAGMFDEVRDVEADGTLAFHLDLDLDLAKPDSVRFSTSMKRNTFRIRSAGQLTKMNSEFIHAVYENDHYVRSFAVGPSNPYFTPLDAISINVKNAILTSEDGSFFFHNGFNEDAFRKSIAANVKAHRFVRGGSTISMQLIKNVFLNRKKTIARKAEEALMVWLIESNRLTSKERMFEVYLNIIELGPDVYGIGEASRYYFDKSPSEITLSEAIFLANLLPRPKAFKYNFDENGNLKPYLADYYRVVTNFLLRKTMITQEEYDRVVPNVELKGRAREVVFGRDSIQ